ncbi:ubiquinol-cytochrome c reductase iron-sulfur subunit [Suttonella ornithocola]|uniref:Ubiquinol-cytochrome c reductase iron-sulfur subunit n=1 Tax=Suttonella ornithocola TaxID=279832 RepID=A0A380N0J3_9GAMM|nr:ubiquinol-cytochrome c reductase iron-sulfur subunit [Suttonella ornithocola]SUO97267.1 Ubiquinol-cytochrome c reductase iron-sulfur subunit [Suttonella ornithocola]
MSNNYLKPSFIPANQPKDLGRRKMLIAAASAGSAIGVGFVAVPFLSTWLPSERAKAIGAPVTVDFSKLAEGALQSVLWQGKVVYILRRTPEMLATLDQVTDKLRDPNSKESIQPEYADNEWRAERKDIGIMLGVCTHLGCAPKLQSKEQGREERGDSSWLGGFFCPCHGSAYDYAGRVYKGVPAPTNLTVPPYHFTSDNVVVIGEGAKNG